MVSDRSVYSSLAYQGGARRLGVEIVHTVNAAGLGEVWPHLVVLLELDPGAGLARQEVADRIGAEGVEFQERVAATYRRLAEEDPRVVAVDGHRSLDEVVEASLAVIRERFDEPV